MLRISAGIVVAIFLMVGGLSEHAAAQGTGIGGAFEAFKLEIDKAVEDLTRAIGRVSREGIQANKEQIERMKRAAAAITGGVQSTLPLAKDREDAENMMNGGWFLFWDYAYTSLRPWLDLQTGCSLRVTADLKRGGTTFPEPGVRAIDIFTYYEYSGANGPVVIKMYLKVTVTRRGYGPIDQYIAIEDEADPSEHSNAFHPKVTLQGGDLPAHVRATVVVVAKDENGCLAIDEARLEFQVTP